MRFRAVWGTLAAADFRLQRQDSNLRPPGYEPGELPLLHAASVPCFALPSVFPWIHRFTLSGLAPKGLDCGFDASYRETNKTVNRKNRITDILWHNDPAADLVGQPVRADAASPGEPSRIGRSAICRLKFGNGWLGDAATLRQFHLREFSVKPRRLQPFPVSHSVKHITAVIGGQKGKPIDNHIGIHIFCAA